MFSPQNGRFDREIGRRRGYIRLFPGFIVLSSTPRTSDEKSQADDLSSVLTTSRRLGLALKQSHRNWSDIA
jgi:hypothetical protein